MAWVQGVAGTLEGYVEDRRAKEGAEGINNSDYDGYSADPPQKQNLRAFGIANDSKTCGKSAG